MNSVDDRPNRLFPLSFRRVPAIGLARLAGVAIGLAALFAHSLAPAQPRDRYADERNKMVDEEIAREGIKNPAVLKSMRTVPRHLFAKSKDAKAAYHDQALPIGHKQTISPPFIVAYMTEMLDPHPTDVVLEIGTGSGYQAAVLSGLVKEVYTIEIVPELGKSAAKLLKDLKYENVHAKVGDGYQGWPEHAPFDKIIVTCSPEEVPEPLIEQLKEGGKMIVPTGKRYEQVFYLFEKQKGELVKTRLIPALFVPMTGDAEKIRKVQPDPKHPEINNGSFETDDGEGHPVGWHYQRQLTLESKGAPEGEKFVTFNNQVAGRSAMMLQGMTMDGRAVGSIKISLRVRGDDIRNGPGGDQAAFVIQFYDGNRGPIAVTSEQLIGPWDGSFDWKKTSRTILVPRKAREAIVRVGLNGATGALSIDDIRLAAEAR